MPYEVVEDAGACSPEEPFAVKKLHDGALMGCHPTLQDAQAQVAALSAAEDEEDDGEGCGDMHMAAKTAPWRGPLAVEGIVTGDGREFAPNALTWADLPLPLRWNMEDSHGGEPHTVAVNVGRIDTITREGDQIMGTGVLNLSDPNGQRVYDMIRGKFLRGVSIDADSITDADVEMVWPESDTDGVSDDDPLSMLFSQPEKMVFKAGRIRAATLVDIPAFAEAFIELTDSTGAVVASSSAQFGAVAPHSTATSTSSWDGPANEARLIAPMPLSRARAAYAWIDTSRVQDGRVVKDACRFIHHEVSADGTPGPANLTACSAGIGVLNGGRGGTTIPGSDVQGVYNHLARHLRDAGRVPPDLRAAAVTASVETGSWAPPAEWFDDPKLSVPTGITIDSSGRVYGHAAQWGTCHVGYADECVSPPHEDVHDYFMSGEVVTADGRTVSVGQITVGTGHASLSAGHRAAAEHYDHTGFAVADVCVGNDAHGIWVAGSVRPSASSDRVHELRASGQVSGDWRRIGGKLRLVGLLAVNVPGFPVPRMRARVASGAQYALVAAGRPSVVRRPAMEEKQAMRIVMDMLSRKVKGGE